MASPQGSSNHSMLGHVSTVWSNGPLADLFPFAPHWDTAFKSDILSAICVINQEDSSSLHTIEPRVRFVRVTRHSNHSPWLLIPIIVARGHAVTLACLPSRSCLGRSTMSETSVRQQSCHSHRIYTIYSDRSRPIRRWVSIVKQDTNSKMKDPITS
jgi:hypothetical protein